MIPNDAHLRRIAYRGPLAFALWLRETLEVLAISANWRNGATRPGYPAATAAGLSPCRRGPSRSMNGENPAGRFLGGIFLSKTGDDTT